MKEWSMGLAQARAIARNSEYAEGVEQKGERADVPPRHVLPYLT